MIKNKLLAVVGPTGSGKTVLGLKLAEKFHGVIISADSRQVYRGLDVGTNKEGQPGDWQGLRARYLDKTPQLLIDVAEPGRRFTLADWLKLAEIAIEKVYSANKLPIIVGGTGLYVTALLEGWTLPGHSPEKRRQLEGKTLEELQQLAEGLELNESEINNRQRLVRILERESLPVAPKPSNQPHDHLVLYPEVNRQELFERVDRRYERIFDPLMIEIKKLIKDGVDQQWFAQIGHDYRFASLAVTGQLAKEEAISQAKAVAREYIRRQETWWRHHLSVTKISNAEAAVKQVERFLASST